MDVFGLLREKLFESFCARTADGAHVGGKPIPDQETGHRVLGPEIVDLSAPMAVIQRLVLPRRRDSVFGGLAEAPQELVDELCFAERRRLLFQVLADTLAGRCPVYPRPGRRGRQ